VVDSDHQDRHRAYQRTPGELALPPSYLLLPGIARSPSSRVGRRAPPHHLSPELVPVNPSQNRHHHHLQHVEEIRKPSVVHPRRPCSIAPP
jgi:hypothetical protein